MMSENDTLMEIVHLASAALVADQPEVKRQALADIADSIASLLPVEGKRREAEEQSIALAKIETRLRVFNTSNLYPEQVEWLDETRQIALDATVPVERAARGSAPTDGRACRPATAEEPQGLAKFLTVAPGVTLVRFAGKDEIKLVARRVGSSGSPNTIFEIMVDKAAKVASVWRDSRILFEITGVSVNYSMIEKCAVSALHRWFKNQRKHTSRRRHKGNPDYKKYILSTHEELARTVAEQKEGL